MTKAELMTRVSQTLEDEGLIHFTSEDLSDSIQDGYELVSMLCETVEKVEQITIPSGSQIVDITTLVSDYYRCFAIYSEELHRWLSPRSFPNIQQFGLRWGNDTGNIRDWCPLGEKHILFYPSPNAAQVLQFFYKAEADILTSDSVPIFFEDCHKVLEYYACSDLLDQNLEYTKSLKYYNLFQAELDEISQRLQSRGMKSRILELACKFTVTPISTN